MPIEQDYSKESSLKDFKLTFLNFPQFIILVIIRFYQIFISPALPQNTCRFYPTCSRYGFEAVKKYGAIKGTYLAIRRILRCNPFNPGGYDPVPEKIIGKKDMKQKKNLSIVLIISITALLFSSCTSRVGVATSWPGFSLDTEFAYLSFGAETYAINLDNGTLEWKYPSEEDRTRQAYSAPKAMNDIVVFGDYANDLIAVDASNGTEKWMYSAAEDRYIGSVEISQSMIYAPNTDGHIYALDLEGNLEWKFLADGPNWTKPVVDGENIYIASMDHNVYAIQQAFNASDLELAEDGTKTLRVDYVWKTDLDMAIVADPVMEDGVVYIATIEGKLFAIDANSGDIIWSFDDGGNLGAIWGSPVVSDDIIFFADINGEVYTVEKDSGNQYWPSSFNAGGKIIGGGALTPDGVVFATDEGKLFMINTEKDPKTITSFDNAVYTPLSFNGENILVAPASEEGLIAAFNLEGFETWSYVPAE